MCLRFLFGPSDRDIARAQWALIDNLERAVGDGWRYADNTRQMRNLVREARRPDGSPQGWARAFAQALQEVLAAAQQAEGEWARRAGTVEALRLQVASYQRIVEQQRADPLQARVEALTAERDRWQADAGRLTERVRGLEATLAGMQQAHDVEVTRLRGEVAALNRIVVEQQEVLNARQG